jgi:ankyrin repeat protein
MKHLLLTTIAAVLLVGCGSSEADRALFQAVKDISIEAAKQAIADGADVDAKGLYGPGKGSYGLTHLSVASALGDKEIVELLIAEGADVNAQDDKFGMTPLFMAAGARSKGYRRNFNLQRCGCECEG